jgi:hypothetical protein
MLSLVMLNVIMLTVANNPFILSVIMLSVVMLNVFMLSVVAPLNQRGETVETEGATTLCLTTCSVTGLSITINKMQHLA